jgi:hypothetical protein
VRFLIEEGVVGTMTLTGILLVDRDPQAVKIKTGATMQSKSKKPGVSVRCWMSICYV